MDLSKLNTKALRFSSYDAKTNKVTPIAAPYYSIDKDGWVTFTTRYCGSILITDRAWQAKK